MKSKFTVLGLLCLAIFCRFESFGQTARVLFINNNSGSGASSLDVEVRVMPSDTVFVKVNGIAHLDASAPITVPASTILKISFLESGTSTSYYTYNNAVLSTNDFKVLFLTGTAAGKQFGSFSAHDNSSAANKVKYNFRHSTPTLGEIDLVVRQTSEVMADNYTYGDGTFSFNDELNAADYILDMYPFNNSTNGLFAYNFPGATLGNDFVVLFTAGTSGANDMYMAEMNGTVTKLTTTAPIVTGVSKVLDSKYVKLFPVPATAQLQVELPAFRNEYSGMISVFNLQGQLIIQQPIENINTEIDISAFAIGMYVAKIESAGDVVMKRFIKE